MAADEEDGVEVGGLTKEDVEFLGGLPDGRRVVQERDGDFVFGGFDRGRVKGRFAAFGGRDGDVGFGVEDMVRVGELWEAIRGQFMGEGHVLLTWEVPAGRLVEIAELVVGGEYEEDLGGHFRGRCDTV